ncbi:RabGAP/TBC protein [Coccomyxa subellipsoidea C-169]|uniref:RabGAP/TBC protein n=1 Tax=Coccomyxa subellipsoidea (strain C-169) TaxID=574566 RepID=I0YL08_COCSC|nr:RabGAP/TBC protein [Coccomyxa subellipsoidea C-169]EIE19077.1 RabGAP/TBC protein [Coccomyxa subellipsoidea C-169]|eukprot:XP_005643621.1 RabGAP/TBC protein [Coccomyxa subellipsoidea C-169]
MGEKGQPRYLTYSNRVLLLGQVVDLDALRELAWSGVPADLRPVCWQLLLGYLPPNRERREQILERKRREYRDMVPEYYDIEAAERSEDDNCALRQVIVDVPRTAPGVPFFSQPRLQKSLERILFLWGIRHPASGYVQGINDLVTPFLAVFLSPHFEGPVEGWPEGCAADLPEEAMTGAEADSYWCLCKLLDSIQDHYTHAQPGIQRTVFRLQELVRRIDEPFAQHLEAEGLEFLHFQVLCRWVNCLLIREIPFSLAMRLWDTYLAEGVRMKEYLTYVLAAFLLTWSADLKRMDFQEMILFLQKLPTGDWGEKEVESVLSRAYMWRTSFDQAKSHLQQQ